MRASGQELSQTHVLVTPAASLLAAFREGPTNATGDQLEVGAAQGPCGTCTVLWQRGSCLLSPQARLPPQHQGHLLLHPIPGMAGGSPPLCSGHLRATAGHATSAYKGCLQQVSLATALGKKNVFSNPRFQLPIVFARGRTAPASLSSRHCTQHGSVELGADGRGAAG